MFLPANKHSVFRSCVSESVGSPQSFSITILAIVIVVNFFMSTSGWSQGIFQRSQEGEEGGHSDGHLTLQRPNPI